MSLSITVGDGGPVGASTGDSTSFEAGSLLDNPAVATDAGAGDENPPSGPNDQAAPPQMDAPDPVDAGRDQPSPDHPSSGNVPPASDAAPDDSAAADAGGSVDEDCVGGWIGHASDDTPSPTPASGYGGVQIKMPTATEIVSLHTVLTVPSKPPATGTLFLWPGLQPLPGSKNFDPIGNGVLQPVLTWGGTCAPDSPPQPYASWWISAQYVNTYAKYMGHTGCNGGPGMTVAVADSLDITMTLQGTTWHQVVVDSQSGEQVSYDIDMLGQSQDWAIFSIEGYSAKPVTDVVFTSTKITVTSPQTSACQPSVRGQTDYFATPMTSSDGLTCCVSRIILRAQGVAATTPDGP